MHSPSVPDLGLETHTKFSRVLVLTFIPVYKPEDMKLKPQPGSRSGPESGRGKLPHAQQNNQAPG